MTGEGKSLCKGRNRYKRSEAGINLAFLTEKKGNNGAQSKVVSGKSGVINRGQVL